MTTSATKRGRRRAACVMVGGALLTCAPAAALAHHSSSTTRIGDDAASSSRPSFGPAVPAPRLSMALGYGLNYFGRVKQGTSSYDKADLGSVMLNTLSLNAVLELASRTRLGLRLPTGLVDVRAADGGHHRSRGFGDVELFVGQELGSWFGQRTSALEITVRGGLTLPTGPYQAEPGLTLSEVVGAPDGSLGVATYNTQASLGADAWAASAGLAVQWRAGERVALHADGVVATPVTRTRDDIRWGTQLAARAGGDVELLRDRVHVRAGLAYEHRFRDEVMVVDDASTRMIARRVAGRDELAVDLGVGLALTRGLTCSIGAQLPVWQRVGGVQLVATLAGTADCAMTWGL